MAANPFPPRLAGSPPCACQSPSHIIPPAIHARPNVLTLCPLWLACEIRLPIRSPAARSPHQRFSLRRAHPFPAAPGFVLLFGRARPATQPRGAPSGEVCPVKARGCFPLAAWAHSKPLTIRLPTAWGPPAGEKIKV